MGPPKIMEVLTLVISRLPLESPETKSHRVYYKGEGGGFPQVWAMVSLVSPNLPMACPSTKSAPIMH
jgi:hypothetical protein